MKIAMVSEHASPLAVVGGVDAGGQNVHVAALATQLGAQGHDVVVYTRRDNPSLPVEVELAPGAVVHHVAAGPASDVPKDELLPYMDAFGRALEAQWRADPPDIVHAHFWMSGVAALRPAAALGIPLVQTFHALGAVKRRWQGPNDHSPRMRIEIERQLGLDAAAVIATWSDEACELTDLGVPRRSVHVVPSGVDVDLFTPVGPAARRPGHPRLLTISRLVPRKGIDDAVRAMRLVPDAELLIIGGPTADVLPLDPEARRLRHMCRDLGVQNRVHLLGRVPHSALPELVRSSDLVLTVPWYEPFGIVAIEAMACGVPVVSTAVGGMLDTVVGGTTGCFVPPRSPRQLAQTIRDLLADDRKRSQMGAAGAKRARALYSWSCVAAATEVAYSSVLARYDDLAAPAGVDS